MNFAKRIGKWIRTAFGIGVAAAASTSSAQPSTEENSPVTYRLTWFELQINPMVYRFAYAAGKPMLISLPSEGDQKGAVLLIRPDHVPEVFDRTVECVDALIRTCGVRQLPMTKPNEAFTEDAMKISSVHLRFAYSDKTTWAGAFAADAVPPEVNQLLTDTKALARELLARQSNQPIDGGQAHEHLKAGETKPQEHSADIVLKIQISANGAIAVDERTVTIEELGRALDALKEQKGIVWYYREAGESEPPPDTVAIIKQVLDAVIARKLPIKLQEEKY